MSYYLMHRGWMGKRIFERERFNRLNAWEWMIEHAAFADERGLMRGQLRHSTRFLAKAWGWPEPKVRRCLSAMQDANMIRRTIDAGMTLITICNYDQYQCHHTVTDAPSDAQSTQDRRTTDADLKKERIKEEDSVPIGTRQSARQITEWMIEVWKEVFGSALTIPTRHNDNRIKTARARFVGDFRSDIGEWRKYLERIQLCPWLMGSKGWKADFDWVLKPANLTKVLEGRYDNHAKPNGADHGELSFGGPPTGPPPIPEGGFFPMDGTDSE